MNRPNFSEIAKIGIVILILAFLLAGFLTLKFRKVNKTQITVKPSPAAVAKGNRFYFNPKEFSVSVGSQFKADIYFHVDGRSVSGADAVLRFDPASIDVLAVDTAGYFQEYPRKEIDNQKGIVKITAFRPEANNLPQDEILYATLSLKTKKAGDTQLNFEFYKGVTNLTTIVEKGTSKNILEETQDARIEIKQ